MISVPARAVLTEESGGVTGSVVELAVQAVLVHGVFGELVSISPGLDTLLDVSTDIEDTGATEATIGDVCDRWLASPVGGIVEDGGVPDGEVGIVGDLGGQAVPLGLGGHDTRVRTQIGKAVGGGPRIGTRLVVSYAIVGGG